MTEKFGGFIKVTLRKEKLPGNKKQKKTIGKLAKCPQTTKWLLNIFSPFHLPLKAANSTENNEISPAHLKGAGPAR